MAETKKIFSDATYWKNDMISMLANLLAASTAMRQGEVLALRC